MSIIQILSQKNEPYTVLKSNDDNHGNYKQVKMNINPKLQDSVDFINGHGLPHDLSEMSQIEENIKQFVPHIKHLWSDKAIKIIYDTRHNYFENF